MYSPGKVVVYEQITEEWFCDSHGAQDAVEKLRRMHPQAKILIHWDLGNKVEIRTADAMESHIQSLESQKEHR